ncbi:hypothetical protein CQA53_04440 [Helicobacter didelphidarum]|uniref:Uncharacterized protein n=1 Tax=Helicobacter didelphidarum TaxID=2040648 RepID=A0A3D8IMP1_9HELI|nr:hypothetical protein [Helicobacter didelphidarum]RDU66260.1 hypothetical protein CQA53_04440 [Helicobacter didelphidarum]
MTLQDLENLTQDEMIEKTQNLYELLEIFAPLLLAYFKDPKLTAKLTFLALRLKDCLGDFPHNTKNQKIDKTFHALDLILQFKKQNQDEFEKVFEILQDLLETYKRDKQAVLHSIRGLAQ